MTKQITVTINANKSRKKRRLLGIRLHHESDLVREESIIVLKDFAACQDEGL